MCNKRLRRAGIHQSRSLVSRRGHAAFFSLFQGRNPLYTHHRLPRKNATLNVRSTCEGFICVTRWANKAQTIMGYAQGAFRLNRLNRNVNGWLPEPVWRKVKASVPIACVDVILCNPNDAVLLGWRLIHPYVKVWATPGGRIRMGESLTKAAQRILSTHRIMAKHFYLVGVFPIKFPSRFDISICVASESFSGTPVPDGTEFKRLGWFRKMPKGTGKNYVRMIREWRRLKASAQILSLNQI